MTTPSSKKGSQSVGVGLCSSGSCLILLSILISSLALEVNCQGPLNVQGVHGPLTPDRSGLSQLSPITQGSQLSRLSRAFERLHFGPLLRWRDVHGRRTEGKIVGEKTLTSMTSMVKHGREKKGLSFFSRFYPLQPSLISRGGGNDYSSRRRGGFSSERESYFPSSSSGGGGSVRIRPIMRLRWGK